MLIEVVSTGTPEECEAALEQIYVRLIWLYNEHQRKLLAEGKNSHEDSRDLHEGINTQPEEKLLVRDTD